MRDKRLTYKEPGGVRYESGDTNYTIAWSGYISGRVLQEWIDSVQATMFGKHGYAVLTENTVTYNELFKWEV